MQYRRIDREYEAGKIREVSILNIVIRIWKRPH